MNLNLSLTLTIYTNVYNTAIHTTIKTQQCLVVFTMVQRSKWLFFGTIQHMTVAHDRINSFYKHSNFRPSSPFQSHSSKLFQYIFRKKILYVSQSLPYFSHSCVILSPGDYYLIND